MHSFHSTVSRRDFMKTLGLAGAGVGAAAATFPVFHDLDELMSAPQAQHKQPWFVKDVDKPTIDIDWSQVVRSDKKINGHDGIPYLAPSGGWHATGDRIASYPGGDANRKPAEDYIKSKFPDWKGDTLRDQALRQTVWTVKRTPTPFVCSKLTYSPEEYGLPKYEGTPEENYVMIRNLLRFWGGGKIGVIKLDQDTRKVFNANSSNKDIVFEDVDEAYETTTKTVVPNKNEYLITALFTAQTVLGRRWPSLQSNAAVMGVYSFLSWAEGNLQEFLHGIGYEANVVDNITNSEPCGLVAGVGENVRMGYTVVSPETGAMARCMLRVITDLPLATTKPVDAGLNRFCNTCKICADAWYEEIPLGLKEQGAQIFISPAAWPPEPYSPYPCWESITRKTGLPLVICNRTGQEDDLPFYTSESLVMKDGRKLAAYASEEPALLTINWDFESMQPLDSDFCRISI